MYCQEFRLRESRPTVAPRQKCSARMKRAMSRIDELLLIWEESRERGDSVTAESLCPDDPTLRAELAEKIRLLEQFQRYFLTAKRRTSEATPRSRPRRGSTGT